MFDYYLQVEGVNLDSVLSDTSQLSVIRGSSLLLREATVELHKPTNKPSDFPYTLEDIATGASTGLYSFKAEDDDKADNMSSKVANWLNKYYGDFTFVVDTIPKGDDFQKDLNKLCNKNRYQQLQHISFALPDKNTHTSKQQVACSLDGVRPVGNDTRKKDVSPSVDRRFWFGKEQRQKFYARELKDPSLLEYKFTNDLASLANSDDYGNLNNKIAVIYLDGNSFGSLQKKYCKTPELRSAFDKAISKRQQGFLSKLLHEIHDDPEFLTDKNEIRLEVLMWGGDEVLLVVPAWKGFWTLQQFYKAIEGWTFPENERNEKQRSDMTYAGGIVFSQANTPMYRLREIAKDLAENAKETNRDKSLFDYLVLESLDYPSEPLYQLRENQYKKKAEGRTLLLPFDERKQYQLKEYVSEGILPKSQVMSLAHLAAQGSSEDFEKAHDRLLKLIKQYDVTVDMDSQLDQLFKTPSSGDVKSMFARAFKGSLSDSISIWPWIHLAELWDYLFIDPPKHTDHADKKGNDDE